MSLILKLQSYDGTHNQSFCYKQIFLLHYKDIKGHHKISNDFRFDQFQLYQSLAMLHLSIMVPN